VAHVDLQYLQPTRQVRWADAHPPVEAARPQQCRVQDLRAVGGGQDDHALVALEPVHLGEDLVQRLLALVHPARREGTAARPADRIKLVDKDDRRRHLLGLIEQVAHPAGPDPHDRLDELGGGDREERHARLPRHGPGEEGLARAGRAGEQHAARDPRPEPAVALRVAEEVDDLPHLVLDLVDSRDVGERGPRAAIRLVEGRPGPAEPAEAAQARGAAAPEEPQQQPDEQQGRAEPDEDLLPQRRRRVRKGCVNGDALGRQRPEQVVGSERRTLRREQADLDSLRRPGRVAHRVRERSLDRVRRRRDHLHVPGV
jgi:hypothetical protein